MERIKKHIEQAKNTNKRETLIGIMRNTLGYQHISNGVRKKSVAWLKARVIRELEEKQLMDSESPEAFKIRQRIATLQQQYEGKIASYHDARNPQKVLNATDDILREIDKLERELA